MSEGKDHIPLVRQAQQGHPEARDDLLRIVEPRLAEYVGRLTLDRDLTTDIVQESIAEMLKIFDTLKDPQRFWCWLYTITLNKVRAHYRQRWRRERDPAVASAARTGSRPRNQDVLAELVTQELKEIVVRAVGELEPRQRAVLTMRCYEQMSYAQISAALGCSQLGARALFHRAKKTLARLLRSRGIDKGALPVALLVFGKLSATSEAAAAGVSIPASTLHVGPWADSGGRGRPACRGGDSAGNGGRCGRRGPCGRIERLERQSAAGRRRGGSPAGTGGLPGQLVLVLLSARHGGHRDDPDRRIRPSPTASGSRRSRPTTIARAATITIRNHRQFAPDLSVWRLPTDPPALRAFLRAQDRP